MALTIVTWWWGEKYPEHYVRRLEASVRRHLKEPHRFLCVSDHVIDGIETVEVKDPGLTKHKGCIVRLRLFDEVWQRDIGIRTGDRVVNMDLDSVVTGQLDPLFCRPDSFTILVGANAANPCPYNGSLFMLRAGSHAEVWDDFTLAELATIPRHEFPDDQGWLAHKLPNVSGWNVGPQSGVYAFQKPQWPNGDDLPKDARLVVFPGWRDPAKFVHLSWVKEHWHA